MHPATLPRQPIRDGSHRGLRTGNHHRVGPLTAAMLTPSVSSGATSSSPAATATIAPPAGNPAINRPRAATTLCRIR